MKNLQLFFLVLIFSVFSAAVVSAQSAENALTGEISVFQQKWRTEIRNSALDEDPFRAINDTSKNESNRIENKRRNEINAKIGLPLEPVPALVSSSSMTAGNKDISYIYETKIRNNSAKQILSINWEYVFLNAETKQELGRLKFVSQVKIGSGNVKNLTARSPSPPTGSIDAKAAGKKRTNNTMKKSLFKK